MADNLTQEQFDAVIELRKMQATSKTTLATRDVMVLGDSMDEVTARHGVSDKAVYASITKIKAVVSLAFAIARVKGDLERAASGE